MKKGCNKKRIHKSMRRSIAVMLAVICVLTSGVFPVQDYQAKTDVSLDEYAEQTDNYTKVMGYREYLQQMPDKRPTDKYVINAADYVRVEGMEAASHENYEGRQGTSVYTEKTGLIEYEVEIKTAGLYEIAFEYYPVEGNGASIQRSIFIDGKLPYSELNNVEFSRIWGNSSEEWEKDNRGNDLKPNQIEKPEWVTTYVTEPEGYVAGNLAVYLEAGLHTITIMSLREPMMLGSITIGNSDEVLSYEETKKAWDKAGAKDSKGQMETIEAEHAIKKSSQMLYPVQDQSTPAVAPYSAKELLNNTIGGANWDNVGDWLEWEFEVDESGYYNISMYTKQNFVQGIPVYRKITIDGQAPFEEMNGYEFNYDGDWRMDTLSDDADKPFLFYLEKGKHTIRMEVVLDDFSPIIDRVNDVLQDLNTVYRKIIRITGVAPDAYRDYQIGETLPGLKDELIAMRDELTAIVKEMKNMAEISGDSERILVTMRDQLSDLCKDVEKFSKVLDTYKTNMSAVGIWVGDITTQPLQMDRIFIYSPDKDVPEVNDGFFDKLIHEFKKLFYSFIVDYNAIGNVSDDEDARTITVWIGSGRDQANVLKSLTDERFTYKTGISVNVMLVDMATLLQATLAGEGPDVAIGVGGDIPMNFGLRNAAVDLTQFEDFESLRDVFIQSSWVPYEYDGAVYGIPETLTYPMMFYRRDILEELELEVPKTWDEMTVALSVLSNNQMDLGMLPLETTFASMLYQNGGSYYKEEGKASNLDDEIGINTFKQYTSYYTAYTLDRATSVTNRFRTGESPIIIADYLTYNELIASAPDIKGLWGFTKIPGTVKEDGTIDYTSASGGTADIMMEACEDKDAAWEFMKWWSSAETQLAYGLELEGIMGTAARYPTANAEAFASLPWSVTEYNALVEQMEQLEGIPQVPGGYYTWRNVNNAFYTTVVSKTMQPREALTENIRYINEEINYKRKEFDLPLYGE